MHLQIKWDEGTRVYVKLGNEWKNKVGGLCGNYNDNAMDDMQTPSQALETSPLIFGHSWRVQKYCEVPKKPIDACKEHPQRETWAQLKCGVLKSNLFKVGCFFFKEGKGLGNIVKARRDRNGKKCHTEEYFLVILLK